MMPAIVFIWIAAIVGAVMGFLVGRGFRREAAVARNALAVQNYWEARTAPGAGSEPEETPVGLNSIADVNAAVERNDWIRKQVEYQRSIEVGPGVEWDEERRVKALRIATMLADRKWPQAVEALNQRIGNWPARESDPHPALKAMSGWDATREDEQRQDWPKFLGPDAREDIHTDDTERFDKAEASDFLHREAAMAPKPRPLSEISQGAMVDEARGRIRYGGVSEMLGLPPATRLPPADEAKIIGELGLETPASKFVPTPAVARHIQAFWGSGEFNPGDDDLTAKPER